MEQFSPEDTTYMMALPTPLLEWYGRYKRDMPWRGAEDAYYIWVSEIMLQQTRVEAVRGYFARFTTALPTIAALAACPENTLLKLWEGLGYYNRARNLQRAACLVQAQYGGELPRSYDALLTLPGIGEYTAGAVASIAYGISVPCVDGNVLRVLSRILANAEEVSRPDVKRAYRILAQAMIPEGFAGDFNQALMELGALLCLPNGTPLCGGCPATELCRAHRAGQETSYPAKPERPARTVEQRTVLVAVHEGRVLLRHRPDSGLLAGLWEFPSVEGSLTQEEATAFFTALGGSVRTVHTLKKAKHIFTHREWRMQGYLMLLDDGRLPDEGRLPDDGPLPESLPEYVWATPGEVRERYALPSALSAYSAGLEEWCAL